MYNVVLVFDLSRPSSLRFITNTLSMLIERLFPVRFGIVPIIETEDSVKMAKVFYYLVQNYGRRATMEFFGSVCANPSVIACSDLVTLDPRCVRRHRTGGLASCASAV